MGFASGSVSLRRFAVVGDSPEIINEDLLEKLAEHALRPNRDATPEEVEYGWSGGRHILDNAFSFENNVFADALHFALRIDTHRAPGDLKRAYTAIEEEATAKGNPSGFISKAQKKDVKDIVRRRMEEEMKEGKFRKTKLLPILWDVPNQMLYCQASQASLEKLLEIFERTFGLTLLPLTAGSMALRNLEATGKRREYEDMRPTRFVYGPEGESQHPEYPWVAKGPEPKEFVGNEFLVWLWHEADARNGTIHTDAGDVTIFFDKSLDLDCAYGQTGKDSLKGDGPTRMPEARDALRVGKVVRKAGLVLEVNRQQFTFTFNPEIFSIGAAQLPEVEEAENPRQVFEERISMTRDLCGAVDGLFKAFLKHRAGGSWEGNVGTIRKWIGQQAKLVAA